MWRPSSPRLVLGTLVVGMLAPAALGQPGPVLAGYLRERGLEDFYADYLLEQVQHLGGQARIDAAQELAGIYIRLLEVTGSAVDRQRWADRAASLLRVVPEADSPSLRMNLARAAYLRAEETAERHRLLLTSEREKADAERILREVLPLFMGLAQDGNRRSERLDAELGRELTREDEDRINAELTEARRQRSLAFYFAGWTSYYLAELTGDSARGEEALRHFGWLLGATDGQPASVDRLQPALLRFEHVARAAIGAGLAASLTGRSIEAGAWIDAVGRSTEVAQDIREQLPARRAVVLARGGQWADLIALARRSISPVAGQTDPAFARLISILSLTELDRTGGGRNGQALRQLADDALAALVAAGQIAQIADLARTFGPERLGDSGFIPLYVRGLLQLEAARAETQGPTDRPELQQRLLEAATLLTEAVASEGASAFPAERAGAMIEAGAALYLAGRVDEAAQLLERAWSLTEDQALRERSLWLSVVALDGAVESGRADLAEQRDKAAVLYFTSFPGSANASLLAIRPSTARLLNESQAIEILLSAPPESPTYAEARRRAAALLYLRYRKAEPLDRYPLAERFMAVAEPLMAEDSAALRTLPAQEAARLAETLVVMARRVADAALGIEPPQPARAEAALQSIDRVAGFADVDLTPVQGELLFRRLQIALIGQQQAEVDRLVAALNELGGTHASAAQRLAYRDISRLWLDRPDDAALAQRVMGLGRAVAAELRASGAAAAVRLGVLELTAQAAEATHKAGLDPGALAVAIEARTEMVELGGADADTLTQLARQLTGTGRADEALELWRRLVQAEAPGSDAWFEARYESLRLLARSDPPEARVIAQQFRALHPDLGPPAWRDRYGQLLGAIERGEFR